MRLRTFLRPLRAERAMSITDVVLATGLARGEISMFERGHSIPRDEQAARMEVVYGPRDGWYPPGVLTLLLDDLHDCLGCGEELDPDASRRRAYHGAACRSAAYRRRKALRAEIAEAEALLTTKGERCSTTD